MLSLLIYRYVYLCIIEQSFSFIRVKQKFHQGETFVLSERNYSFIGMKLLETNSQNNRLI